MFVMLWNFSVISHWICPQRFFFNFWRKSLLREHHVSYWRFVLFFHINFSDVYILNKMEHATLLILVKMAERRFLFQFRFCKIKCLTSSYHLPCTCISTKWKPRNENFTCDFILFLKDKIRDIFELEYMCSVFTFFSIHVFFNSVRCEKYK